MRDLQALATRLITEIASPECKKSGTFDGCNYSSHESRYNSDKPHSFSGVTTFIGDEARYETGSNRQRYRYRN